jgi:hypothetical protein
MLRREADCRLSKAQSLIVLLLYSNGKSLPQFVRVTVFEDFRNYAFFAPDSTEIKGVTVDGVSRPIEDSATFQLTLIPEGLERHILVRYRERRAFTGRFCPSR